MEAKAGQGQHLLSGTSPQKICAPGRSPCPPAHPTGLRAQLGEGGLRPQVTCKPGLILSADPTSLVPTPWPEDMDLITITEDSQPQGPPPQHLRLQAKLQCSPTQHRQLQPQGPGQPQLQQLQAQLKRPPPGLRCLGLPLSRTSSQKICAPGRSPCPPPHPTGLRVQLGEGGPRPQVTCKPGLILSADPTSPVPTPGPEDIDLIAITEDSQPQGPPTQHLQLQIQLQWSPPQPREGPRPLATTAAQTQQTGPDQPPSSLQDSAKEGPLTLQDHREFQEFLHPLVRLGMIKKGSDDRYNALPEYVFKVKAGKEKKLGDEKLPDMTASPVQTPKVEK